MTVLLLAVLTLSVLALYLNFRNRRNSASWSAFTGFRRSR